MNDVDIAKLGFGKKKGHASNQCLHLKMKVLLIDFNFKYLKNISYYIWFIRCKYCNLRLENKMGHAHNRCLHVKMKLLLVGFVLV